jgi:exodeoxyribonuclease VII small subunit
MPTTRDDHGSSSAGTESTYGELVAQLEDVVSHLERGGLPLEEAVAEYERGVELVRQCNDLLDRTELRIIELSSEIMRPSAPGGNGGGDSSPFLFGNDAERDE